LKEAYSYVLESYLAPEDIKKGECKRLELSCVDCGEAVYVKEIKGTPVFCHHKNSCSKKKPVSENKIIEYIDYYISSLVNNREYEDIKRISVDISFMDYWRKLSSSDEFNKEIERNKNKKLSFIMKKSEKWNFIGAFSFYYIKKYLYKEGKERKLSLSELNLINDVSLVKLSIGQALDDQMKKIFFGFLLSININKIRVPKKGYLYIVRNPSHDKDVYKIGVTSRSIEKRLKELSGAGSLIDFYLEKAWWVNDCFQLERITHNYFFDYRVRKGKEFFKVDLDTLTYFINQEVIIGVIRIFIFHSHFVYFFSVIFF